MTCALDHLLGADREEVGLAEDTPQVELGTIVCYEAALGVDGEDVFVAELDVVVVEVVDLFVGELRVEAVSFGVEGMCKELADRDEVARDGLGQQECP